MVATLWAPYPRAHAIIGSFGGRTWRIEAHRHTPAWVMDTQEGPGGPPARSPEMLKSSSHGGKNVLRKGMLDVPRWANRSPSEPFIAGPPPVMIIWENIGTTPL